MRYEIRERDGSVELFERRMEALTRLVELGPEGRASVVIRWTDNVGDDHEVVVDGSPMSLSVVVANLVVGVK